MNRSCSMALLGALALAACSPSADEAPAFETKHSHIPTQADIDKLLAEGVEPSLRKIAKLDYWLPYKLMRATGVGSAPGGVAWGMEEKKEKRKE